MKFDAIVMNPPYQEQKEGFKKSQVIWPKFVFKSFDVLKENGYLVAVHPSGWRNISGKFKDVQQLLKSKEISYLELHGRSDGVKIFGVQTTFDFYCVKNARNNNFETTIKCQDGSIEKIDVSALDFIPNGKFKEIMSLVAKEGEEKVEVLYSRSAYGTDKKNMSKEKNDEFKFPCVYTTSKDGNINVFYSSKNDCGHFDEPKVIWSNGISQPFVDKIGEYGMTQFSYAIVDVVENLENIEKAMASDEFIELMSFSDGLEGHRYNRKIIATFKKDFWKEFI